MKLLIDLGNTRLKWALYNEHNKIASGSVLNNTADISVALIEVWQGLAIPDVVALSSVNSPLLTDVIVKVVGQLWLGCPMITPKAKAFQCGVHSAYQYPEKLGIDRWLALIAVHNSYRHAACIVDCGTAITLDIVNNQGQHLGGLISPGLMMMRQALAQGTHQLPLSDQAALIGLANNTYDGICGGTLVAACGLIERIYGPHAETMPLILTGGDAQLIATNLVHQTIVDDDLVLRGLFCVCEEHLNSL